MNGERDLESPVRFSIRSLLMATLGFAILYVLFPLIPHVIVFVAGTAPAVLSTYQGARSMWDLKRGKLGFRFFSVALAAWILAYLVSIGPVVAIVQNGFGSNAEWLEWFYLPVIWLHEYTMLAEPIEIYASYWGWH